MIFNYCFDQADRSRLKMSVASAVTASGTGGVH